MAGGVRPLPGRGGEAGEGRNEARRARAHAPQGQRRPLRARADRRRRQPARPYDAYGHDMLWWLDRMVRSSQPLVERMALVWHDWFATGDVDSQRLGIAQIELFKRRGLGSFRKLLLDVTRDPAMLVWLSGVENTKEEPNENYGRELMELFTLGAADPATGYPYSEDDVREQARALTGWTADYEDDFGYTSFYFDRELHDTGRKRIFGKKGNFDWRDSCDLCLAPQGARALLRRQAVELLHPDPALRSHPQGARVALPEERLRGAPRGRGDPQAPRLLQGTGAGQAARRPGRGDAQGARARGGHRVVDLGQRPRGNAAVRPAQRRRLGRVAVARHVHVPRALVRGAAASCARRTSTRPRTTRRRRPPTRRSRRRSRTGATRRSRPRPKPSWRASATASPRPRRSPGSRTSTGRCARTRCGCLIAMTVPRPRARG